MEPLKEKLANLTVDFLSLLYPRQCTCCGQTLMKQEKIVCFDCIVSLPRSQFHLTKGNPVEMLFWGRMPIERASSFFIFQKGSKYQSLLHTLKYQGMYETGVLLGRMFASEMKESGFFADVDLLVPVPLHPKKEKQRGYNQSEAIAKGMAQVMDAEVNTKLLARNYYSETQTRKGRWERWKNVETLFKLTDAEAATNKHILLIDDVVTTGSTLEACGNTLLQNSTSKISIATLAYATI